MELCLFQYWYPALGFLSMEGKPIQIVVAKEDHTFELDEEALASIVGQDHVKDKHVAIVSVAGAFRKGKSFLLDFFLRYLKSNASSPFLFSPQFHSLYRHICWISCRFPDIQGSADWLGPEDRPLTGFSWRGGCERDTTGILAWSEVLMVDGPDGEKVIIFLVSLIRCWKLILLI